MFFYKSDTQEIDIEFLSDATSKSNPGDGSRPMHYTNQATNGGASTHATGPARSDATSARHEYRIDWVPGRTQFYLDGVLQRTHTTNVPTVAGSWLWNNWG
jgi:beta-glucanase (GH16 family)